MRPRLLTPIERRVVRAALSRQIDALERVLSGVQQDDMLLTRGQMARDLDAAKKLMAIFGRSEIKND